MLLSNALHECQTEAPPGLSLVHVRCAIVGIEEAGNFLLPDWRPNVVYADDNFFVFTETTNVDVCARLAVFDCVADEIQYGPTDQGGIAHHRDRRAPVVD